MHRYRRLLVTILTLSFLVACGGGGGGTSVTGRKISGRGPAILTINEDVDVGIGSFVEPTPSTATTTTAPSTDGLCVFLTDQTNRHRPYVVKDGVPELLADVYGVAPLRFVQARGLLFFIATDQAHSREVWVTDGTPSGTHIAKDLMAGDWSSFASELTAYGDSVYFFARDPVASYTLMKTDGTATGTKPVSTNGSAGYNQRSFTVSGDLLYYYTYNYSAGTKVYASDGTQEGTRRIFDVNLDPIRVMEGKAQLVDRDGKLYFIAKVNDEPKLVVTDGTVAGTQVAFDLPTSGDPEEIRLSAIGSRLLIYVPESDGDHMWIRDCETGSTKRIFTTERGYSFPGDFYPLGERLLFKLRGELWITDGLPKGTIRLSDVELFGGESDSPVMASYGGLVYFQGRNETLGEELWVTDGTNEGTRLFKDINPNGSSYPREFVEYEGKLYFHADDGTHIDALYETDGTVEGTRRVLALTPARVANEAPVGVVLLGQDSVRLFNDGQVSTLYSDPRMNFGRTLVPFGSNFLLSGDGLWITDGTPGETMPLEKPGFRLKMPEGYIQSSLNGKLYYPSTGGLWETDGTAAGTRLAVPGIEMAELEQVGDSLYFANHSHKYGSEPWVTDGTPWGTRILANLNNSDDDNTSSTSVEYGFTEYEGKVYFSAGESENVWRLWYYDPTEDALTLDEELNSHGTVDPGLIAVAAGKLYFAAYAGDSGYPDYWAYDPINGLAAILSGRSVGDAVGMKAVAGKLSIFGEHGLWVADELAGAARKLTNVTAWIPAEGADGIVYFCGTDSAYGGELWSTDWTADDTSMVKDIATGGFDAFRYSSSPTNFIVYEGKTHFTTGDGGYLYTTDGTAEGTVPVMDTNSQGYIRVGLQMAAFPE